MGEITEEDLKGIDDYIESSCGFEEDDMMYWINTQKLAAFINQLLKEKLSKEPSNDHRE